MQRRVKKSYPKKDVMNTIERKFGSLSLLIGITGEKITPEVEAYLDGVSKSRDPVRFTIAYRNSIIIVDLT